MEGSTDEKMRRRVRFPIRFVLLITLTNIICKLPFLRIKLAGLRHAHNFRHYALSERFAVILFLFFYLGKFVFCLDVVAANLKSLIFLVFLLFISTLIGPNIPSL